MQKRFFSSLALSLLLNLLIKPVSVLVIDAGVQRIIGNEAYGQYFILLSLTLVFNIFLDLGINNYTTRVIAQEESALNNHVSKVFYLRVLLCLLYLLLVLIAGWLININKSQYDLLLFLIINQCLIQTIAFIRSLFSGLHRFKTDTVISVMDRALLIVLMGTAFIFYQEHITVYSFVFAQLVSYSLTAVLAIWLIRKHLNFKSFSFDPGYIRGVLIKSFPFALLVLLMLIYNRSDVVILKQLSTDGDYQAGIYAQGYRLLDAFYMLGMIFAGLLFPVFSRMLHQQNKELNNLIQIVGKLLIGGVLGLLFVTYFNGAFLLKVIYGNQVNENSVLVFNWLMVAFVAMSFNFIFGTLLTAGGFMKELNIIAFIGVICTVFANGCLIPSFGALGCAMAAVATQTVVSVLLVVLAKKRLGAGLNIRAALSILGFFIALLFCKWGLSFMTSLFNSSVIIDVLFVLVFAVIFSIIDIKSLKQIWQLNDTVVEIN